MNSRGDPPCDDIDLGSPLPHTGEWHLINTNKPTKQYPPPDDEMPPDDDENEPDLGDPGPSEGDYREKPYSPARDREIVRGRIALYLVYGLLGVMLLAFISFWSCPARVTELRDLLSIVFGPLAALVGAATGYYFGSGRT